MADKKSKEQIIDMIVEQKRRELRERWDAAQGSVVEGRGDDIHQFMGDLQGMLASFGQAALKAYLEERDDQQHSKKNGRRPGGDLEEVE